MQVLTYGVTMANYDLNSPEGALPRNDPITHVPGCLNYFNMNTLDDFAVALNDSAYDYDSGSAYVTASEGESSGRYRSITNS